MLVPIFTHGTYENTIKAIESGKIKYPGYCWIVDCGQYGFINKNNQLEIIGIPELTGTLENKIILSSLDDGLYQVKGQHKITADHATTFDSSSFIMVVVQTIDGMKKVSRITSDEIVRYDIGEDLSVTEAAYITKAYLDDKGYVTEDYVDAKIVAMEQIILADVEAALPSMIEPLVYPVVEEVVDRMIQPEDNSKIDELFNN